jgi:hypothetical protein
MFSTRDRLPQRRQTSPVDRWPINAGSRDFTVQRQHRPRHLHRRPSDVTVIARGNIDVNGSRIAAYDGGNVTVRSLEGASTPAPAPAVPPPSRRSTSIPSPAASSPTPPPFPAAAFSPPPSRLPSIPPFRPSTVATVGDILVETPRGDIIASAGGVVQIPLNGVGASAGTVTLRAGTRDADRATSSTSATSTPPEKASVAVAERQRRPGLNVSSGGNVIGVIQRCMSTPALRTSAPAAT